MKLDALIFDLDGTLADSIADIGNAMNAQLQRLSLPTHPLEIYKSFVGEGAETLVRRAVRAAQGLELEVVDDAALPRPLRDLTEGYRLEYEKLEHAGSTLYPGIAAMLDGLVAKNVPFAVLSNKRDDFTRHLVEQKFSRWPFVDVRGERDGVPRKPNPIAAWELALELNVIPGNIGFVGDTAVDMHTAKAAGMVGIGVLWGFRDREELEGAGSKAIIESPAQLLMLLER